MVDIMMHFCHNVVILVCPDNAMPAPIGNLALCGHVKRPAGPAL
jgi:hypothetical protein